MATGETILIPIKQTWDRTILSHAIFVQKKTTGSAGGSKKL